MSDFTTTTNFALKKPTVGQAVDTWGTYLNANFDAIDQELQTLTVSITTPDLEDLGNVLADPPTANQYLQFNGENWTGVSVTIPTSVDDLTDVDITTTAPTANQVLTWNGSKFIPASPSNATIADGTITTAKLDSGLQTQIGRILVTDDDDSPTNGQILQYNTTDSEWKYADLPGSTVVTLGDVDSAALADNALLVYNSSAGEFQFESGSTLRTTLGVDLAGTDNSTDLSISSATSYDYIVLSAGQVLTINQVDLQTDVANTLPVTSGGTGSTTVSGARTALGLGTISTQDSDDVTITGGNISGIVDLAIADGGTGASSASAARTNLGLGSLATQDTITESQISDLQSYLTAETNDLSAAVTWANVPDVNITQSSVTQHQAALSITESQISDLQSYLTAETNDLSAAVTWANVPDANITQSSVTQHQAALSITESQISDLQSYLTAETNDLGTAVTGTLGTANGGTGVTSLASLNAADLGSNNGASDATDGYVLTADGTGGVTWEAATIVSDTAPQLGGNLDVNGYSIVSASAGNISITPDTTGKIVLDGLSWPTADGTADQVLKTDGAGNLSFVDQSGGGGSGSSYIEHVNSISDSITVASGNNRLYIGDTTFSGTLTVAGKMVILDGPINLTGTMNLTGTLSVRH